jgi:hypothetical protein
MGGVVLIRSRRSREPQNEYLLAQEAIVQMADEARIRGRRRLRNAAQSKNKSG